MADLGQPKMTTVDAETFEAVGYGITNRRLYVKFRNATTRYYEGVPSFRYQGLMASPRKDAYFKTYIKDTFLAKDVPQPSAGAGSARHRSPG